MLQGGGFARPPAGQRWRGVMTALRGLAEGMAYTHSKRICHGDLNPSNVLVKVCITCTVRTLDRADGGCWLQ